MNLIDIHKTFRNDDECVEYLAGLRWPNGIRCVTCGTDKVKQYVSPTDKQPNRKIYQCQEASTANSNSRQPQEQFFTIRTCP